MFLLVCLGALLLTSVTCIFIHRNNQLIISITQIVMLILLGFSITCAFCDNHTMSYEWVFLDFNKISLSLSLQWDRIAKIMVIFILLIGFFIYRYAQNYLASDQTRIRFLSQLNLVLFSVLLLVMSANLFTAFFAWQLIGISIYLLLNHYHDDPAANRAAKKKFVINRIGDCSFLLALVLVYHSGNNSSFHSIQISPHAELICGLLFISVMTKCAQFPFHVWLIDTMETPTPVSALMHAGIINAGGILLTRISAALVTFHMLNYLILLVGLISAILSIQWMNKQPDTKKKLAYSTMGQMGYMLMQCSLGIFPAAIFHLMSHGFYKASLFLNSGETLYRSQQYNLESVYYRVILKSTMISLIIFYSGMHLIISKNIHIPILIDGFIIMTLITILYRTEILIQSNQFIKTGYYVATAFIFFSYLYCLRLFSTLLLKYEYKNTIAITTQITILIALIILQIKFWTKRKTSEPTLSKDLTEVFLRKLFLTPLRSLGNIINLNAYRKLIMVIYLIIMTFLLICFFYGLMIDKKIFVSHTAINSFLIFCFLSIGSLSLIIANRCKSITLLISYLILFELAFINIAWFHGDNQIIKIGLFHLINITPVILMLILLSHNKNCENNISDHNIPIPLQDANSMLKWCKSEIGFPRGDRYSPLGGPRGFITCEAINNRIPRAIHFVVRIFNGEWYSNRFPARVFYLTFALLLLIGIPGTASFISEFYLLNALINDNLFFVLLYISLIILISIVIMHSLHLYVFKKHNLTLLSTPIDKKEHLFFLSVIGLNILCGFLPSFLLNYF